MELAPEPPQLLAEQDTPALLPQPRAAALQDEPMGEYVEMANVALEAGSTVSASELAEAWERHTVLSRAPDVPSVMPSFHVRQMDQSTEASASAAPPVEVSSYRGSSSESEDRAQETATRQSAAQAQAQDESLGIVDSDRDAAKPLNPDEP